MSDNNHVAGDALFGVEAIVHFLLGPLPEDDREKQKRKFNHLLAGGHLPAKKIGKFWTALKRQLSAYLTSEGALATRQERVTSEHTFGPPPTT